jgi:hypothetical protein
MAEGNAGGVMRDLLYLSENKMRALIPQLPGQARRRLGFEAGFNAGVVAAKASLPGESQPSPVALLDAVVDMIEREKGSRWRTDSELSAGDWIQFEEEFRYGSAETDSYLGAHDEAARRALAGLVYFAATDAEVPFVLCGSSVHVLERWQPADSGENRVGRFYLAAVLAYARRLAELPDEAAITDDAVLAAQPDSVRSQNALVYGLRQLCEDVRDDERNGWATGPVRLSGHARVLAVVPRRVPGGPPAVLATPLYVEYARRG